MWKFFKIYNSVFYVIKSYRLGKKVFASWWTIYLNYAICLCLGFKFFDRKDVVQFMIFMLVHNMNKVSLASVIIAFKKNPFRMISWNVLWFKCLRKLRAHMAQIDLSLFFTVTQTPLPYRYPMICGRVNTSGLKVHGVIKHVLFITCAVH